MRQPVDPGQAALRLIRSGSGCETRVRPNAGTNHRKGLLSTCWSGEGGRQSRVVLTPRRWRTC